mmetsp:Transcript_67977/g.126958  ORF Transcript_67977/g.126958 Transcript_67977/m.126958 type:complete len:558 (-) Transcript_67977:36-1709(-)
MLSFAVAVSLFGSAVGELRRPKADGNQCRFAAKYQAQALSSNVSLQAEFIQEALQWERNFYNEPGISFDNHTGLTYDGSAMDPTTGEIVASRPWTAASKESLHLNLLALALHPSDATFDLGITTADAIAILTKKIDSYETFDATYPGFGGYLPWMCSRGSKSLAGGKQVCRDSNDEPADPTPTPDWTDRVPALDNGQLAWAVHAVVHVLSARASNGTDAALHHRWDSYLQKLRRSSVMIFYHGEGSGRVRTVTQMRSTSLPPSDPSNYFLRRGDASANWLDDPYEGELMVLFMHLLGDWSDYSDPALEKRLIWQWKQRKFVQVDYLVNTSTRITVQEGFWYSAHEQWKLLVLPYIDIPTCAAVFRNVERARLVDASVRQLPGLFASVGEPLWGDDVCGGYCSAVGIQDIANNGVVTSNVVTPYGSYPAVLVDRGVGLAWYQVMLSAPRMQSKYGSVESVSTDGRFIAPLLTWDAKVTNVLAMLGGMAGLSSEFMKLDGIYDEFASLVDTAYRTAFPSATSKEGLKGSSLPFDLPTAKVPMAHADFTSCPAAESSLRA